MAGATTTIHSGAIASIYQPGYQKTFYDGQPLMNMIRKVGSPGGSAYKWQIKSAGNTSGTSYTEGQAPSAAGYITVAQASVSYAKYRAMVQITGHLRDAIKGGYYDAISAEMDGGRDELQYTVEAALIAILEAAIDSAGSYAGLTRSTYNLDSYEAAVGTLALSDLQTLQETLMKQPRACPMNDLILMSTIDMYNEYMDVAAGAAYLEFNASQADGVVNAGKVRAVLDQNGGGLAGRYGQIPWYIVPTMTATTVLAVRPSKLLIVEERPITIDLMAKNDDSDTYSFTWGGTLVCLDTYRAAKLT